MSEIPAGRYRHFKGNEYTVVGLARHSETLEEMVVYRAEYGEHGLWVRPRGMFLESVRVNDQATPRFQRLETESTATAGGQIFADVPSGVPDEIVQTLVTAGSVRIERIVSHGQASPADFWYNQDQHEWVLVLRGQARLRFEDRLVDMTPGDYINIPAHVKHQVAWTTAAEPTIWLAVFYS